MGCQAVVVIPDLEPCWTLNLFFFPPSLKANQAQGEGHKVPS